MIMKQESRSLPVTYEYLRVHCSLIKYTEALFLLFLDVLSADGSTSDKKEVL